MENKQEIIEAFEMFYQASKNLLECVDINDLEKYVEQCYPFNNDFNDVVEDIQKWAYTCMDSIQNEKITPSNWE